jgi:hypothetical protein
LWTERQYRGLEAIGIVLEDGIQWSVRIKRHGRRSVSEQAYVFKTQDVDETDFQNELVKLIERIEPEP